MAKRTVLVSDISGKEIRDGDGATVIARFVDARRGQLVMDTTAEEAKELMRNGRQQARRGRRPKAQA